MRNSYTFEAPTRIIAGVGELSALEGLIRSFGSTALIVTDAGVSTALDVPSLADKLTGNGLRVPIFDEIEANPRVDTILRGASHAKASETSVIIALGGGSVIDAAKGIAIVATHGGNIWDFIGDQLVPGPVLPIISVPTTSGTGSEVNPFAVFSRPDDRRKDGLYTPHIFPRAAILDPEVTRTLPKSLTAETGLDALAHAIEGYTSKACDNVSAGLAERAIALVARSLVRAVEDGSCLDARLEMATASALAGLAIVGAGVGAAHGFGMSIGGLYDAPHGRIIGVLMPEIMEYNTPAATKRHEKLAHILRDNDRDGLFEGLGSAATMVGRLRERVGLPSKISALGVTRKQVDEILDDCMDRQDMVNNPAGFTRDQARDFLVSML